jgi:hypothetical protein
MIKRNSISILLLFLSFLAQSAFAQTASITGTIKDSSGGNPIWHEAHILKAFDIERSQSGGLSSFAQEFCRPRRSCNAKGSIAGPA